MGEILSIAEKRNGLNMIGVTLIHIHVRRPGTVLLARTASRFVQVIMNIALSNSGSNSVTLPNRCYVYQIV